MLLNCRSVLFTIFIFLTLILLPSKSSAQEMEPRNYSSVPMGLNAIALNYAYSTGDIVTDATSPIKDLELNSNTAALGYFRSFGLFGRLCKIQASLPFVFLGGNAKLGGKDTSGSRTGFADSKIKFVMNIVGSPALYPKDFMKFKEDFVLGASLAIAVPTGQYSDAKLINLGSNRWGFKPEIGVSFNKSNFYFELFSGVWLFTKNTKYLGTNTVYQNPLFSVQGHISYIFPSKIWLAFDAVYVTGGATKVNGVIQNNFQNNARSGITISFPINMNNSVKASFSKGVATRFGGNFTTYTFTYQLTWF